MSPKIDLVQQARENAQALDDRLSKMLDGCGPTEREAIDQFKAWLQSQARISVNLSPSVLAEFIHTGHYLNAHEWADDQEYLSGRPREVYLTERLGAFRDRRVVFDASFVDGEKQQYGALNAGGPGCVKFGPFCIVLKDTFATEDQVVFLICDSLSDHFWPNENLDLALVCASVAPHSHRHVLAAIKHFDAIPARPQADWPTVLLDGDIIIEAIYWKRFAHIDIQVVRVRKEDWQPLWDLAFADYGKKLEAGSRALVLDVATIRRAHLEGVCTLEVV